MKAKILWFSSHTISIEKDSSNELKKNFGRGWVGMLESNLRDYKDYEIAIAFPNKNIDKIRKSVFGNRVFYEIPFPNSKLKRWYQRFRGKLEGKEFLSKYMEIIQEYDPDLIHIFGTENSFSQIIYHTKKPVLVDIQGLLTHVTFKWFSHISKWDTIKYSSIFHIINLNTHIHQYKIKIKRAKREQDLLRNVKLVSGRTTWDKMVTTVMAPNASYYHCSRVIKDAFWSHSWKKPENAHKSILTVMNPDFYKGLDVVFQTCEKLTEYGLDFTWNVVGVSEKIDYVKIISKKLKLKPNKINVRFLGKTTSEDIAKMLTEVDFYVHPSYMENSPNSVAEAMIVGTPTIASVTGGVPDYIDHKKTGWIFQEGDYYMVAGLILNLLNDDNVIKIAEEGRKVARIRHNPETIAHDAISNYNNILGIKE